MLKNLDTLNADEMREMLKNINDILDSKPFGSDESGAASLKLELIGNEFFADGMNEAGFNDYNELLAIISEAKTHYILNLAAKNIAQWGQVFT